MYQIGVDRRRTRTHIHTQPQPDDRTLSVIVIEFIALARHSIETGDSNGRGVGGTVIRGFYTSASASECALSLSYTQTPIQNASDAIYY